MRVYRARTTVTAALAAALMAALVASCSTAAGPPDAEPTAASEPTSASGQPSVRPTGGPFDPDHAVDPPGRRTDSLEPADVLIYSQDTLGAETLERIDALEDVEVAVPFSMAQVSIENRVLTLAAVDPGAYRRFLPLESADARDIWERVAGGELALTRALQERLPLDRDGYLRLGNDKRAPVVHVGAYSDQLPQVDAVVNPTWGEELGMPPGNAVVISTGAASPTEVQEALLEFAGDDASVQRLDVVAREGLDTSVQQTALLVGSVGDAVGVFNYTVIGGGRIAPDPSWVRTHISSEVVPILGSVTCNNLIFPQLRAALLEIVERGLADEIYPEQYAGCYYPRFIAGTTTLSNHSFGLALDLNVPGNLRGTVGEIDRTVVSIFKKWGFGWGGDWRYTDPMHFEMNALVRPG